MRVVGGLTGGLTYVSKRVVHKTVSYLLGMILMILGVLSSYKKRVTEWKISLRHSQSYCCIIALVGCYQGATCTTIVTLSISIKWAKQCPIF